METEIRVQKATEIETEPSHEAQRKIDARNQKIKLKENFNKNEEAAKDHDPIVG